MEWVKKQPMGWSDTSWNRQMSPYTTPLPPLLLAPPNLGSHQFARLTLPPIFLMFYHRFLFGQALTGDLNILIPNHNRWIHNPLKQPLLSLVSRRWYVRLQTKAFAKVAVEGMSLCHITQGLTRARSERPLGNLYIWPERVYYCSKGGGTVFVWFTAAQLILEPCACGWGGGLQN